MRKLLVVIVFVAAACSTGDHPVHVACTEGTPKECDDAIIREAMMDDFRYGG